MIDNSICEHGSMRRKCDICELLGDVRDLEAKVTELTAERDGLLAADVEYDAANRDWEQATSHDPGDISDAQWKKIADRFERAIMHRLEVMDGIQSRRAAKDAPA